LIFWQQFWPHSQKLGRIKIYFGHSVFNLNFKVFYGSFAQWQNLC
jgi:hypothetical protein